MREAAKEDCEITFARPCIAAFAYTRLPSPIILVYQLVGLSTKQCIRHAMANWTVSACFYPLNAHHIDFIIFVIWRNGYYTNKSLQCEIILHSCINCLGYTTHVDTVPQGNSRVFVVALRPNSRRAKDAK